MVSEDIDDKVEDGFAFFEAIYQRIMEKKYGRVSVEDYKKVLITDREKYEALQDYFTCYPNDKIRFK